MLWFLSRSFSSKARSSCKELTMRVLSEGDATAIETEEINAKARTSTNIAPKIEFIFEHENRKNN
jgi:hypothetical protein